MRDHNYTGLRGLGYTLTRERYNEIKQSMLAEWLKSRTLINERLNSVVSKLGEDSLPAVARHILQGGKRFRGFLVILTAKALGAREEDALDAAVAIELVQAASLAIDDIIDKDEIRRGKPSAWRLFGIEKTVLSSLFLIPFAQKIVEKLGFKALFHVIRAWETTVRGEIMDSVLTPLVPPSKYLQLIEMKTAALFKLATILGVLSARESSDSIIQVYGEYGGLIGIIYQLADDIADYTLHTQAGKKLEGGEQVFISWAKSLDPENPLETAKRYLQELTSKAQALAEQLPMKREEYRPIFSLLPAFLMKKLFDEAGISSSDIIIII
jgi:geranylgeranyl pyrophosphate synthase